LFYSLAFTNNADAVDTLILGRDMETWLIYTLIFLGITFLSFAGTWLTGILINKNSDSSIKHPLE
tara:strand:- start:636 stop:830 length:195 start_codon:yes stop_codon:yes gene_type:complete